MNHIEEVECYGFWILELNTILCGTFPAFLFKTNQKNRVGLIENFGLIVIGIIHISDNNKNDIKNIKNKEMSNFVL